MECLEAIHTRRSVRQFAPDEVSDADLERLLRAAMAAPSAGNQQPWRFVVVREAAVREQLATATPYAAPMMRAPLGIVVLADEGVEKFPGNWALDCGAATQNLLLAAHAIGLGGVWMGVYPEAEREAKVARIVGAEEDGIRVFCMIAVGTPSAEGPVVDRYRPEYVRHNRWS